MTPPRTTTENVGVQTEPQRELVTDPAVPLLEWDLVDGADLNTRAPTVPCRRRFNCHVPPANSSLGPKERPGECKTPARSFGDQGRYIPWSIVFICVSWAF